MVTNSSSQKTHKPAYTFPWLIWVSASVFFFYQFILRVSPSVSAEQIMQDLAIPACSLGVLASWYYYGYTGMQIIVGLMLDRIGIRYPLTLAVLSCVIGCYLFSATENIAIMSTGRFLMGVGSAFGFLSCVKIASIWFSSKIFPTLIGWSILIGPFGGAFGTGTPMAKLVNNLGWRETISWLGIVGIIIGIMVILFVRDHPKGHGKDSSATAEPDLETLSVLDSLKIVLHNPQTYLYGLYAGFMYITLAGFADLWGKPFVAKAYGVDDVLAAGSVSMFYLGIGAGGPIGAWVVKQLQSYKKYMLMGSILNLIMFSLLIYVHIPAYYPLISVFGITLYVLDILLFITGLFAGSQFFAFACVCELNPKSVSATATGIQNMAGMMSGILFQPILGLLLDWSSGGKLQDGLPFYTTQDFRLAFTTIPISIFCAIIVCFFLREMYPVQKADTRN